MAQLHVLSHLDFRDPRSTLPSFPYLVPAHAPVNPFGPPTPPASSPPKGHKVVPFQSDRAHAGPEGPRKERPQPTPANPCQQPGEEWDVTKVQPDSDAIKFSPG